MPLGCWLSLVPTNDDQLAPSPPISPSQSSRPNTPSTTNTSTSIPFKKATTAHQLHKHDHHPSPSSFLKPMVLECPPRRKKSINSPSSCLSSSNNHFQTLPLLDHSNHSINLSFSNPTRSKPSSCFEIRSLQLCDIEKVRDLHSASLPVTYPSSFFYNLLGSNSDEKICLVATLPSTSAHGYFDMLSSLAHQPNQLSSNHHCHLGHHHVTSPLSGRKPISLDVVGSITAQVRPQVSPVGAAVRILSLCVSPAYRRFGVGRLLLESMLKQIKTRFSRLVALGHPQQSLRKILVNLHVQATNRVAYAFYQSAGFLPICFKPAYYCDDDLKPIDPTLKITCPASDRKIQFQDLSPDLRPVQKSLDNAADTLAPPSDSQTNDIDAWFLELAVDCP